MISVTPSNTIQTSAPQLTGQNIFTYAQQYANYVNSAPNLYRQIAATNQPGLRGPPPPPGQNLYQQVVSENPTIQQINARLVDPTPLNADSPVLVYTSQTPAVLGLPQTNSTFYLSNTSSDLLNTMHPGDTVSELIATSSDQYKDFFSKNHEAAADIIQDFDALRTIANDVWEKQGTIPDMMMSETTQRNYESEQGNEGTHKEGLADHPDKPQEKHNETKDAAGHESTIEKGIDQDFEKFHEYLSYEEEHATDSSRWKTEGAAKVFGNIEKGAVMALDFGVDKLREAWDVL